MRTLNLLLIAVIAVGVYCFWSASQRFRDLQCERNARTAQIGEFDVGHERGVRLQTKVGEEKRKFSWQLLVGSDVSRLCTYGFGVGVSQFGCGNSDVIVEVEFHQDSNRTPVSTTRRSISFGANGLVTGSGNGGSGGDFASGAMHRFLNQHWQDLEISVLQADGHQPQDLKTPMKLLSIRVPDELAAEFESTWSDPYSYSMQFQQDRDPQVILELNIAETLPAEVQQRTQATRVKFQKLRQSIRGNKQGREPASEFNKPQDH